MPVYECLVSHHLVFRIKADSDEDALWWCQSHDMDDIRRATTLYDDSWEETVEKSGADDFGIDISTVEKQRI